MTKSNIPNGQEQCPLAPATGYAALQRADRYPQLKHIDADLLDDWRLKWGNDPDGWDVSAIQQTQLARNLHELTHALRHNDQS